MAEETLTGKPPVNPTPDEAKLLMHQEFRLVKASDGTLVRVPVVTFDGHKFFLELLAQELPTFEMAARARRGDATAVELLDIVGLRIVDADKRAYWPLEAVAGVAGGGVGSASAIPD